MHLVQILLPLADNEGKALPWKLHDEIRTELTERFRGLTAYTRAPAEGTWKPRSGVKRDEIIVYEVMVASLDVGWWKRYKKRLEKLFRQEQVIIRAQPTKVM
jgi:hypothetical protein